MGYITPAASRSAFWPIVRDLLLQQDSVPRKELQYEVGRLVPPAQASRHYHRRLEYQRGRYANKNLNIRKSSHRPPPDDLIEHGKRIKAAEILWGFQSRGYITLVKDEDGPRYIKGPRWEEAVNGGNPHG